MNYSPDSTRLVYVAGLGSRPPAPRVVVRDRDQSRHVVMEGGRAPVWLRDDVLQMVGPDHVSNLLVRADAPSWGPYQTTETGLWTGNQHVAAAGKWAVGRTDPRRIITSWRGEIHGASDPALSPDGEWFAYVQVTGGAENLVMVEPTHTPGLQRERWGGDPVDLRFGFGSTSLTWGTRDGRIYGHPGVGNTSAQVVELGVPGGKCSHARSVWVPDAGELWVGFVLDVGTEGVIYAADWGSCERREPTGYRLGASTNSGFDWNLAVAA